MPQYFENDENLKKEYKQFSYTHNRHEFDFTTCSGVFAKDGIDGFSIIMVNCIIDNYDMKGDVLDLGCGYGAIGIIIKKHFPDINLYQIDINETAVELTKLNCKANCVDSEVILSDGFSGINKKFDWVLLNPPIHAGKDVVYRLLADTKLHLNHGGKFCLVIHKKHGAESALKELRGIFNAVELIYRKKGVHVVMCS